MNAQPGTNASAPERTSAVGPGLAEGATPAHGPQTVLALIDAMADRLDAAGVAFGHGTQNADDEAAWLVLWRLGLALDALDEVADDAVPAAQVQAVEALIGQRIASRQPAAYLTGEAWLQGLPFTSDARSIVPRSLIAEPLMAGDIDPWLSHTPLRVLDLCTGNGSLAVLCALAWPQAAVHGCDVAADALALAHTNVARHGLADRITLALGDGLTAAPGRFDLIVCNPPYVNTLSMTSLPPEYLAEPALALAGGADGMDFIRNMLQDAAAHLHVGGALVLEIGHERAHFAAAWPQLDACAVWLPTSAGDDQVLLLTRAQLSAPAMPEQRA